ncbi:hypothetical protein [uncultured Winogradskyella sp.]|uniref:hypothetical protein n=1 Tax=Winogradskyella sp. 4-2091 TaxID=3381659 RepID=UPI00262490F2|nr:hypothetical protein [uncultured Winogradskyella sp.]
MKLIILGENNEKTKVIDSLGYRKNFKNYTNLNLEVKKIQHDLTQHGFIDSSIDAITKKNDSVYQATLYLGNKIKNIRIRIHPNLTKQLPNLSNSKEHVDLSILNLQTYLKNLNSLIAEEGDPFATVQLINITKFNLQLITADLKIVSNKKRRIDKIVIKGYDNFPKSYVKHFLKLKTEKLFNLNTIKNKIELLNDLRFASKIKDPEVLFTKDSTTLYIYVEKTKTNNFDGFLGFGTNEDTNRLEFDGYLDLRLVNNLNYGETLNLLYKSDEIDQQTFKVDADLPYIFSTPIGLQVGLNIFRKDSTFLNANQYAKINYKINSQHSIGIGITSTNSTNLQDDDTNTLNDYTSNYYTLQYNYIKPQTSDPLFPIKFWFNFSSGFGDRKTDLNTEKQTAFNLETYKIFNLNRTNSIYAKISGATLTSNNYLDNELFRFGGINSIRGFEENSLVANLYGVLSTEYRYRLSSNIYVNSVFDAAYFENKISNTKEKLFGFGLGFGLLTNTGLFRFNYSSGKTENRAFKLSDSKVHVSLTATF